MNAKCSNCGRELSIKRQILMPDNTYICISCWNYLKTKKQEVKIKVFEDGIPGIVISPSILTIKEIHTDGRSGDIHIDLKPLYYQIVDNTEKSLDDVVTMVNDKIEKFRGLVSEETALYMVARDLGINLDNGYI